jgi:hypothetical protein
MPLHEDMVTKAFFVASICCEVGSDSSTFFWLDPWFNDRCLSDMAPELFTVVALRARKCTVVAALANGTWIRDILGPLTILVIGLYLNFRQHLEGVRLDLDVDDRISWCWSHSGTYSASSVSSAMFLGSS